MGISSWKSIAVGLCLATPLIASAQSPVIKIHEGTYWTWYARSDQYQDHRTDVERYYDYADRAFGTIIAQWGIAPKRSKFNLLVMPKLGGGFAAGDIDEVHSLTGVQSPVLAARSTRFTTRPRASKVTGHTFSSPMR